MKTQNNASAPAIGAHTPGPWMVAAQTSATGAKLAPKIVAPHCHTRSGGFIALLGFPPEGDRDANARLLASAPELVAALRELVAAEESTIDTFSAKEIDRLEAAMKVARAAIAKATEGRP